MEKSDHTRVKNTDKFKEIIMECVKEIFAESFKPVDEQDVRGVLGFPFDNYIIPLSMKVEDTKGEKGDHGHYTYMWKLMVPLDDPEVLANLDEQSETFEEKLIEAITKRLRSPAKTSGGQYTTGFAEVEKRGKVQGKKVLIIKVEMTVGWEG